MKLKLGKFKKFLDEECPECGDMLQIRTVSEDYKVRGIIMKVIQRDHVICMSCKDIRHSSSLKNNIRRTRNPDKDFNWG